MVKKTHTHKTLATVKNWCTGYCRSDRSPNLQNSNWSGIKVIDPEDSL